MRPGQNRRMRGRNNNNRKSPNPLTRSYESNGPDVKVRGTAQHIAEKYTQLARDAQASGDPVAAENYLQHAEHYYRIIAAAQAQQQAQQQSYGGGYQRSDEGDDGDDGEGDSDENFGHGQRQPPVHALGAPQPDIRHGDDEQPQQGFRPQQQRDRQDERGGDNRRERFRRNNQPRFNNRNGENQEGEAPGLPSFLTNPVRVPVEDQSDRPEAGAPDDEGEAPRGPRRRRRTRYEGRNEAEGGVDDGGAPATETATQPGE